MQDVNEASVPSLSQQAAMSYRSFKRVLGETNLERKCRLLFGGCLFLLIMGSFWWSGRRMERFVERQNRQAGRDFVDLALLKYHYVAYPPKELEESRPDDTQQMLFGMIRDMQTQPYQWNLLSLHPEPPADDNVRDDAYVKEVRGPRDEAERKLLLDLKARYREQLAKLEADSAQDEIEVQPLDNEADSEQPSLAATREIEPVHAERREKGKYHYYQPVYFRGESCLDCHSKSQHPPGSSDLDDPILGQIPPFWVIHAIIPARKTQVAINTNRALLLATAILTVFVAMVAMYLIVRYVVVKPLKHLRDVSDEISRGNIHLRADIHTNDEFEELASAFNRMMRSLVDAQNALKHLNENLDNKVDELAQANMKLYEMNRLKGDFLANMSHELRTPLNSILGFSDVLKGIDALNDKQQRYVVNIQQSGRLLLDMINDILDLAKVESGKMEIRLSEFRISAVVKAQCDLVRSLTEEKNIDLETHIEPDLPPLYQDQSKVQQILTNLLSNAIKFTPEGGLITVNANQTSNNQLALTVTDTGVGIAEEDRSVIFEKFRQGNSPGTDSLTRSYTGTGLGLSIVKELCKLLGGDVSFESDLGKGSSFTVHLPWRGVDRPLRDSSLATKLDEITKPYRLDLARPTTDVTSPPVPVEDVNAEISNQ
ncbi:MAG: HAMP domain-containing histidine kinase [Pirellulaceae bacterium]|nr:HAMP domain-containing histidine kinase [Pirellulaceae bacterium]